MEKDIKIAGDQLLDIIFISFPKIKLVKFYKFSVGQVTVVTQNIKSFFYISLQFLNHIIDLH